MQFTQLAIVVAVAIASVNAAPINVNTPALNVARAPASSYPILSRASSTANTTTTSQYEAQAAAIQKTASSQYQSQAAALEKLNVNTVTIDQLKPIIAQITATSNTAGAAFKNIANQAKSTNSKRQAILVPAIDQLVVDLNHIINDLQPLLVHLTTNLELGTVQELVNSLEPALISIILGVEGLLTSLAPGLSTIVDPLLHTVYGLTDALGLNLNL